MRPCIAPPGQRNWTRRAKELCERQPRSQDLAGITTIEVEATPDQIVVELTGTVDVGCCESWGRRPPRRPRPLRRTASRGQPMKRTPFSSSHSSFSLLAAVVVTTEPTRSRLDQTGRHRHHNRPASTTSAPVATTATTQPSQSTTSTVTTDAPTTSPTTVSTDQTDWASVVQTLGQRRQDLHAAPDVSRIRECAEELPVRRATRRAARRSRNKGWHVVDADPYTVVSAGSRTSTATASTLHWSSRSLSRCSAQPTGLDRRLVGCRSRGLTPRPTRASTPRTGTTLGRSGPPEDPWRIISQERIREVPG